MGYIMFIFSTLLPDFYQAQYKHLKIFKTFNLMMYLYPNWPKNLPGKFPRRSESQPKSAPRSYS